METHKIKTLINNEFLNSKFLEKIAKSIEHLMSLDKTKKYSLSFSGGKDSHALLGLYLLYLKLNLDLLNIECRFADTELEHHSLINSVKIIKTFCMSRGIPFKIVKGTKSYWYYQFGLGYPVPDYRTRWCTQKLKIDPLKKQDLIPLTGAHYGESRKRDKSLDSYSRTCGGDACGTDTLKKQNRIDPILDWDNDDVWTFLLLVDGLLLPEGTFNRLQAQYAISENTATGSLRLGCIFCPVVGLGTIKGNYQSQLISEKVLRLRFYLENLRNARRLKSPRTKKNGALYIEDRRITWRQLEEENIVEYLKNQGWITSQDIELVREYLKQGRYPPTYSDEWILGEHERIKRLPMQISLFN